METTTFVNLVRKGIVKSFSVLRVNSSGYPFITLINSQNAVTNMYFSKAASQIVLNNFGEGEHVTAFLKEANVTLTQNEAGEERYKISTGGNYLSAADALGISSDSDESFDYAKFSQEFANQSVSAGS